MALLLLTSNITPDQTRPVPIIQMPELSHRVWSFVFENFTIFQVKSQPQSEEFLYLQTTKEYVMMLIMITLSFLSQF